MIDVNLREKKYEQDVKRSEPVVQNMCEKEMNSWKQG